MRQENIAPSAPPMIVSMAQHVPHRQQAEDGSSVFGCKINQVSLSNINKTSHHILFILISTFQTHFQIKIET